MLKIMSLSNGEELSFSNNSLTAVLQASTTSVIEFINADYSNYKLTLNSSQVLKLKNVKLRRIYCVSGNVNIMVVEPDEDIELNYIG